MVRQDRSTLRDNCWLILVVAISAAAGVANAQDVHERDLSDLARETPELEFLDQVKMRLRLQSEFAPDSDFGSFSIDEYRPEVRAQDHRAGFEPDGSARHRKTFTSRSSTSMEPRTSSGWARPRQIPSTNCTPRHLRLQGTFLFEDCCALLADDERWSLHGRGILEGSAGKPGPSLGSGSRGGGTLAVGYQIPGRLELALGVQLSSKLLRSGMSVSPVLELGWKISDRWYSAEQRLRRPARVPAEGRPDGLCVRSPPHPTATGSTTAPAAWARGESGSRRVPTGLGLRWDALPWLRVTTSAGVLAWQELRSGRPRWRRSVGPDRRPDALVPAPLRLPTRALAGCRNRTASDARAGCEGGVVLMRRRPTASVHQEMRGACVGAPLLPRATAFAPGTFHREALQHPYAASASREFVRD